MSRKLSRYIWAVLWGIIMLLLMAMPSNDMPGVSFFEGFDKLAHCGFFFVFTTLLLLGSVPASSNASSKIWAIVVAFLISSVFAFGTEAIQYYTSAGRQAEWWDIFADYVGIGMALFSYLLFFRSRAA